MAAAEMVRATPGQAIQTIMQLRTITLCVAIMQVVTLFCGVISFFRYIQKVSWADNAEWFVMQPLYLISHFTMVVFFFVLFARQK